MNRWMIGLLIGLVAVGARAGETNAPAGAVAVGERELTVSVTVPDAGWRIAIREVAQVGHELWVLSELQRDPDMMAAQVISTVRASVRVKAPALPVRHFATGKTWNWQPDEPITFIADRGAIADKLAAGKVLYSSKPAGPPKPPAPAPAAPEGKTAVDALRKAL